MKSDLSYAKYITTDSGTIWKVHEKDDGGYQVSVVEWGED